MTPQPQELLEQLRRVLATSLDADVTVVPGTMTGTAWRMRLGTGATPWTIAVDAAGAEALARALSPGRVDGPAAVAQAVHDWCGHAVGNEGADAPELQAAELVDWTGGQGVTVAGLQCAALGAPVAVAIAREADAGARAGAGAGAGSGTRALAGPDAARFGALMDVDVPLVVRFGCTDMTLKALSRLGPGSLIDLSRAPDDPVEVLVGGRVIARGEVVVVSGSYGIRIVDVGERAQALAGEAER